MYFNIGGVNVELFGYFIKKIHWFVISQLFSEFLGRRNKLVNTFTPPILNLIALSFQNSFSYKSSSYQIKVLQILSQALKKRP